MNTDLINLKKNALNKQIYIKTEPGGKIVFGRLNGKETKILLRAIKLKKMPEILLELRTSNNSNFKGYEGVVNNGDDGDWGNEGVIKVHSEDAIELHKDTKGKYLNGAYLIYLSLSKVSIDFTFKLKNKKFDKKKFAEISIPISVPEFIKHDLYGHPSFNIVTAYQYDGKNIDEYSGELEDRGYDDFTAFVLVKNKKPCIIYKNYNDEEKWF